jgi:hypothetical protein
MVTGSQWASPKNRFKVTTVTASGTATSVRNLPELHPPLIQEVVEDGTGSYGVLCRTGRGVSRRHGGRGCLLTTDVCGGWSRPGCYDSFARAQFSERIFKCKVE